MIEVHFLIPVADNAGAIFASKHDGVWEAELIRLFGGYSNPSGLVSGGWISGSTVYRDCSRVYVAFVSGLLCDGPKVMEAVGFAKGHYGQLALSVRYLGQAEIL